LGSHIQQEVIDIVEITDVDAEALAPFHLSKPIPGLSLTFICCRNDPSPRY
jgi:hypothetical protein